jgi:hypothetical protein
MESTIMAKNAKKTARKTASKKSAKNARSPATKFAETAKIKANFTAKEIPAREGTGRFERLQLVLKHNGKTVGSFVEHGGLQATLGRAVKDGWVKVA